jgi:hypothetical protein
MDKNDIKRRIRENMAEKKSRKMIADLSAKYSPEKQTSKLTAGALTQILN